AELGHHVAERGRSCHAVCREPLHNRGIPVPPDDLVTSTKESLDHVPAHLAQSNDRDLHHGLRCRRACSAPIRVSSVCWDIPNSMTRPSVPPSGGPKGGRRIPIPGSKHDQKPSREDMRTNSDRFPNPSTLNEGAQSPPTPTKTSAVAGTLGG